MGVFFRLLFQGVRDLFRTPWSLCMTLAAITLVSFLGGAFLLFMHNLNTQIASRQGNIEFQIYWNADASREDVQASWAKLSAFAHVVNVRTFTPDQALQVLGESFHSVDFSWMRGKSPLPPTALVECLAPDQGQKDWANSLISQLQSLPKVETVHFNPLQLDMLSSWVSLTKKAFWPVSGFLLVIVALVVGNTIKLALLVRREELEILRFVGASRLYIQFPLLVGGAFQGFFGSVIALACLKFAQYHLNSALNIPPLWITVSFFPQIQALAMIAVLTFVGVISSKVALRN